MSDDASFDPVFEPLVAAAQVEHELAGIVFGEHPGLVRLSFRLGELSVVLIISTHDMQGVAPLWPDKLTHALRTLRRARATREVRPKSARELDDDVKREAEARKRRRGEPQ